MNIFKNQESIKMSILCVSLLLNATPLIAMENEDEREYAKARLIREEVIDPEERIIIHRPADPDRLRRQFDALPRENRQSTGAVSLSQLMGFDKNY